MDPNEVLRAMRMLCSEVKGLCDREELTRDQKDVLKADADELADAFLSLDEWLKTGGFLPVEWQREHERG